MLKTTILAALAAASMGALAQDNMMMDIDAKTSSQKDVIAFINKDAYQKLNAPDAYILTSFIGSLPGNYQSALVRGLAANIQATRELKMKKQTEANMMAPMGDMMAPPMDSGFRQGHQGERSFEMIAMDPMGRLSYADTIALLQEGQDATDQALILSLFMPKSFTMDPLMSPKNEREFDAVERYIKANAMSTMPVRLKYTSLAPHTYAGLPADWASKPWPAGS